MEIFSWQAELLVGK